MISKFFLMQSLLILLSWPHNSPGLTHQDKIFGVDFSWQGSTKAHQSIQKFLKSKKILQGTLDPDCLYKKQGNILCAKNIQPQLLKNIENFSKKMKKETQSDFNYIHKKKRDFSGLAQGYVIDMIRKKNKTDYIVDFAGDVYIAPQVKKKPTLYTTHPMSEPMPFAVVNMKNGGWMITSGLTLKTRRPQNISRKQSINKLTLFANHKMQGARLDAWATAIIAGGTDRLRSLRALKKYKKHWGYLYFDTFGKAHCSANIKCQFSNPLKRVIDVQL